MTSIRSQILAAIKTALDGMSVAHGYHFDYARIEHADTDEVKKESHPFVRIEWNEDKEPSIDPTMAVTLTVTLTLWTIHKHGSYSGATSLLLSDHAEDIEKAVGVVSAHTWGGLANNSAVRSIVTIAPDDGWVGVQVELEVIYEHRFDDPSAAP